MNHPWPPLARAVAAHGLPGHGVPFPAGAPDGTAWAELVVSVKRQRLAGLLALAVADGAVEVDAARAEQVAALHRTAMVKAVVLERALLTTTDVLGHAGVDLRVLKGTAVAHLDYPDPAQRCFGDVDLLVRAEQFDAAIEALRAGGYERLFPEPRPGFQRRFGKGNCMVTPEHHEIDLHRTLAMGPFGLTIVLDDLWANGATFRLAGQDVPALAGEERFLHACFHASLGDPIPRLSVLRDVAQMLLTRPLDLDRVRRRSAAWRADAVIARAVALAGDAFALQATEPLLAWARAYEPDGRERQAMAVYTDPHQTYAAKSFAALRAIPGLPAKAAYLRALAFPDRSYLAGRHESRLHRWTRGLTQVVRPRIRP